MKKGFALPLTVGLIVALGLLGIVAYLKYQKPSTPNTSIQKQTESATPAAAASSSTVSIVQPPNSGKRIALPQVTSTEKSSWKGYVSTEHKFSIMFPSDIQVTYFGPSNLEYLLHSGDTTPNGYSKDNIYVNVLKPGDKENIQGGDSGNVISIEGQDVKVSNGLNGHIYTVGPITHGSLRYVVQCDLTTTDSKLETCLNILSTFKFSK